MKILHTSDWHVGRGIRGRSRADEHRAVLAEIAGIAERQQVDLVLVAGDQFDTSAPSAESETIVYGALLRLARTGAQVVVVAGNHDDPRRLVAIKPLLDLTQVHAAGFVAPPDDGGVLEIETASGEVARVALMPFVSKRSIVRADALMAHDADDHATSYAERCKRILGTLTAGFGADTVNLVVAHLALFGGSLGGGERQVHTLDDYCVPSQAFPATAHYVAMGHLHRPQSVSGPCPIWYSGSPLHLDFGEAPGDKCVLLVEATPGLPAQVTRVTLTSGRRLRTLRGTVEQLAAHRGDVGDDFLRIVVEEAPRVGLADEVRDLFGNAVDVAVADPQRDDQDPARDWTPDSVRGSPTDLFAEYLADNGIEDDALTGLFTELLEEVHAPEPA